MRYFFSKLLVISCICLNPFTARALDYGPKVEGQKYTLTDTEPKTQYVVAVKGDNGKWGFVDSSNKEKIKPKYDAIGSPSYYNVISVTTEVKKAVIPVKLNGKWGFVDQSGKEVIKPIYDWVGDFRTESKKSGFNSGEPEGVCLVVDGNRAFTINHKGKQIAGEEYFGVTNNNGTFFVEKKRSTGCPQSKW